MAAAGYRQVPEHARKHRAMVAQVEAFADRVRAARASTPLQLMEFLKGWLTNHILSTDMDYRESLMAMAKARG
jgi:hemerythrin